MEKEGIEGDIIIDRQYLNPDELINYCQKEKRTIKVVSSDVSFNNKLVLKDISLTNKGDDEDKVFGENPFLHKNIRRGNTVLEILNDDKQVVERCILRKGLKKFFDVYVEYLELDKEKTVSTWVNKNKHFAKLKALTIDPIQEAFSKKEEIDVHIYKLGKANGENASVSYNKRYDAWAISSKNVCMLVQSQKDISVPEEQRYSFSRLIAQVWIAFIKNLEQSNPQLLNELKEYLNEKTIVGEYCGNQDYQHLVKYDKIDLHFYAIVENKSRETCIPPEEAYKVFDKFGLTKVEMLKKTSHSWKEFNAIVYELYKEVGSSPIETDGEGAVLYFVSEQRESKLQNVLSLCKLKTLEYRILRKLREKLKNCLVDKKGSGNKWFKKFEKEVIELCEFCDPPREINYYNTIAKTAFDFVESSLSAKHRNLIAARYITFLDMIKKSIDDKIEINLKFLKDYFEANPIQDGEGSGEGFSVSNLMNNIKIIIVSPPFYLSDDLKKKICEKFNITKIGDSWTEGKSNVELISIDNIHIVPRITSEKLNKHNLFIFTGYTDERIAMLKYQIDVLKLEGGTQEEMAYVKSNQLKKIFTQNLTKIKELKQKSKTILPNNAIFLDDQFKYSEDNHSILNEEVSNTDFVYTLHSSYKQMVSQLMKTQQQKKKLIQDDGEDQEEEQKEGSNNQQNDEEINLDSTKKANKGKAEQVVKKNVVVIVPITIPATGKTRFFKKILETYDNEQKDIQLHYVSSDAVREEIMNEIKSKNPSKEYTLDELFEKSNKTAKSRFENYVTQIIDRISDEEEKQINHIVILDKNHPPSAITSTIPFLQSIMPYNINSKIVALSSKIISPYSNERFNYPFSLTYLLNCIDRCLNRESHETLVGSPNKLAGVVIMFFNLYKDIKFNAPQLQKFGFQRFIDITFHNENKSSDDEINSKLLKRLEKVIKSLRAQDDFTDNIQIQELIESLYETNPKFENVEYDVQKQEFIAKLNEIFNSFK